MQMARGAGWGLWDSSEQEPASLGLSPIVMLLTLLALRFFIYNMKVPSR